MRDPGTPELIGALVVVGVAIALALIGRALYRRKEQPPRYGGGLRDNIEKMRGDAPFRRDGQ